MPPGHVLEELPEDKVLGVLENLSMMWLLEELLG